MKKAIIIHDLAKIMQAYNQTKFRESIYVHVSITGANIQYQWFSHWCSHDKLEVYNMLMLMSWVQVTYIVNL